MKQGKRILIAPLDWGLGHATRCIPIIQALQQAGHTVLCASSGGAYNLLKAEFPQLKHFMLPQYHPSYPMDRPMIWNMAEQTPKFIKAILAEHKHINKIVPEEGIEVIISDNRYGCHSKTVKSILVTHQLNILMPTGWKYAERAVNFFNHRQIQKFDECWVPAPEKSVIPELTYNNGKLNVKHIGYLSRFEKKDAEKKYDVAAVVSGPPPQSQFLAYELQRQLDRLPLDVFLVRGHVRGQQRTHRRNNFSDANFLQTEELNKLILQSRIVISRPGYTTVMDLIKLGAKAIFIPTPGQTEQEYIATELMKSGIAYSMGQNQFNIEKALKESEKYKGFGNFDWNDDLLKQAVETL